MAGQERMSRTRLSRHYEKQKRELKPFNSADHVRKDWDDQQIEAELENRARGYSGLFRQYLCSAAAVIHRQRLRIAELERDRDSLLDEEAQGPGLRKMI